MNLWWAAGGITRRCHPRGRAHHLAGVATTSGAERVLVNLEALGFFPALEYGVGRAVLLTDAGGAVWPRGMRNTVEARTQRLVAFPVLRTADELARQQSLEERLEREEQEFWGAMAVLQRTNTPVYLAAMTAWREAPGAARRAPDQHMGE